MSRAVSRPHARPRARARLDEDLVVIIAGYKDRVERFFASNPGMSSRIAHHLDFPDYGTAELLQIAQLMLQSMQYRFDAEANEAFKQYLERRMHQRHFANARSVRNALDRAAPPRVPAFAGRHKQYHRG